MFKLWPLLDNLTQQQISPNLRIDGVPVQPEIAINLPCIRCGDCAKVCPINLLPQQLYWHSRAANLDQCKEFNLFACTECGHCEVVCPSNIPLVKYFRDCKSKIAAKERESEKSALAKRRHELQLARRKAEKEEKEARAREKREALAKLNAPVNQSSLNK